GLATTQLYTLSLHDALPILPVPKEVTTDDMDMIVNQFVSAAQNAEKAGFDMIELQAHHGFLLASFLSSLTNKRSDEFGGSIENRSEEHTSELQSRENLVCRL